MDFETMIRTEVRNGKSVDDLCSIISSALNEVLQEENQKKVQIDKRKQTVESVRQVFVSNYDKGHLGLPDVGALAVLCVEKDYPDWTEDDIQKFHQAVVDNVKTLAELQGKSPMESLAKVFSDIFDNAANKSNKNAAGASKEKCNGTCGVDKTCTCGKDKVKTDAERIREFINRL